MNIEKILNHYVNNSFYYQDIDAVTKYMYKYVDNISELEKKNFYVYSKGIYTNYFYIGGLLPNQGWKIHISCDVYNAIAILRKVINLANMYHFSFKSMISEEILLISTQKFYSREQAGKFITIYPSSDEQFKFLLEILYKELSEFKGPYILTDKRYKDSKVIYYRYGSFIELLNDKSIPSIISTDGELMPDIRSCRYIVPSFIQEIVNEDDNSPTSNSYLFNKYKNIKPIRYTNSGGVYTAQNENHNDVIIKESRPYTCVSLVDNIDTIGRRRREASLLRLLENEVYAPILIDDFVEWEHYFLVEEKIEGRTIREFILQRNPFLTQNSNRNSVKRYLLEVLRILEISLEIIRNIHEKGYIIGDLSTDNIMVENNSNRIVLIDFESCFSMVQPDNQVLSTYTNSNVSEFSSLKNIDYKAMCYVFFEMLIPKSYLRIFGHSVLKDTLITLLEDFHVNPNFIDLWEKVGRCSSNEDSLELNKFINKLKDNIHVEYSLSRYDYIPKEEYIKLLDHKLLLSLRNMITKSQNVIPDSENAIELGKGFAGIIQYLSHSPYINQNELRTFEKWLITKVQRNRIDIKLIDGTLGSLLPISKNHIKYILEDNILLDLIHFSEEENLCYANGLSGKGVLLLRLWQISDKKVFLEEAIKIGDYLVETAVKDENSIFWKQNNQKKVGLFYGNSGISYFLLCLFCLVKNENYLLYGKKALQYDLNEFIESFEYKSGFPKKVGGQISFPYLEYGTAGVLAVVLRYYIVTEENLYKEWIDKLAPTLRIKYAVLPGYFDGLAGIGHVLMDLYDHLGNSKYKQWAEDIVQGIELGKVEKNEIIFYPSEKQEKLSYSLDSGLAGILSLYRRFYHNIGNDIMIGDDWILNFEH